MTRSEMIDEAVKQAMPNIDVARDLLSIGVGRADAPADRIWVEGYFSQVRHNFRAIEREQNQRREAS